MLRRSNEVTDCEENNRCFLERRDCGGCTIYIGKLEDEEESGEESDNDSEEDGGDEEVEDEDDNNEEDQIEQE